jgi:ABC-type transport system involved in cytochrome c biogenesis ATPase subunit
MLFSEESKNKLDVLFCLGDNVPVGFASPFIVIVPLVRDWSDRLKTDCRITIFANDEPITIEGKFAFRDMKGSSRANLVNAFSEASKNTGEERDFLRREDISEFYTMLPDIEAYRYLIRVLGLELANVVLSSTNDMAFARAIRSRAGWFVGAQRERVFAESFLRSADTFFAFHNASFLIQGLEEERLDAVSTQLDLHFQFDGFLNEHHLRFSFSKTDTLPKNIAVIIGKNGVGKSQALTRLVLAALKDDREIFSEPGGGRPMISRILAMATPGETVRTFPPEPRTKRKNILYRRLSLGRAAIGSEADGLADLVLQLSRAPGGIRNRTRWETFIDAIKIVMDPDTLAFPLRRFGTYESVDDNLYSFNKLRCAGLADFVSGDEEQRLGLRHRLMLESSPRNCINGKLYQLSSGQTAFLRFALQACLYIENGTLVLLDEPETHLHPNLISRFAILLNQLLVETGSIAIISTHSAYLVREVPKSQVHVLRVVESEGGKIIHCDQPRLGTFGSNVGAISHFVFEDNLTTSLMEFVKKGIDAETLDAIKDDISLESYMKFSDELERVRK